MRSPRKPSPLLSALIVSSLFSQTALAYGPIDNEELSDETPAARAPAAETQTKESQPRSSSARFLSLAEARAAFGGEEFSVEKKGQHEFKLFGVSTEKCLKDHFSISNDPNAGVYKIYYKGGNDRCLNYSLVKADVEAGEPSATLSSQADALMTAKGDFESVGIYSENPLSDAQRQRREELLSRSGEKLGHESEGTLAKRKKEEEQKVLDDRREIDLGIVSKCQRNLSEIDVRNAALDRLSKDLALIQEKGDDWLEKERAKSDEREFAYCLRHIRKDVIAGITESECESRLERLSDRNEKYASKAKGLYFELARRFLNSVSLTPEEAMEKSLEVLAKLEKFDLSEAEQKEIEEFEKKIHIESLRKAAALGSESESYKAVREKSMAYLLETDPAECVRDDGSLIRNSQSASSCRETHELAMLIGQSQYIATGVQQQLVAKAETEAKLQNCSVLRAVAASTGKPLSQLDEINCSNLEKIQSDAISKTTNAGISTEGHAKNVEAFSYTPANAAGQTEAGAFMRTGYSPQQPSAQVHQPALNQPNPAQNVRRTHRP